MSHDQRVRAAILAPVGATAVVAGTVAAGVLFSTKPGAGTIEGATGFFFVGMMIGTPIAVLHMLFLALPLYFWLRKRTALTWPIAALAGSWVAVTPSAVLALANLPPRVSDGTLPPLSLGFFLFYALLGLAGAVAGLAFWKLGHAGDGPDPAGAA